MSQPTARITQAEIARALRAMKAVFGMAAVVFNADGSVHVVAAPEPQKPAKVDIGREIRL